VYSVRVILWTVAMAYTGFLLTGQGLRTFNSLSITEAFLGALTGLFLAVMFTLREKRRQRPALIAYSIAQILPSSGISPEDRAFAHQGMRSPRDTDMKSETKRRLRAMSNTEREKRLDELNRKLGITQPNKLVESDLEEFEEREWLKKKLGYKQP
jgi:hypothetical protein